MNFWFDYYTSFLLCSSLLYFSFIFLFLSAQECDLLCNWLTSPPKRPINSTTVAHTDDLTVFSTLTLEIQFRTSNFATCYQCQHTRQTDFPPTHTYKLRQLTPLQFLCSFANKSKLNLDLIWSDLNWKAFSNPFSLDLNLRSHSSHRILVFWLITPVVIITTTTLEAVVCGNTNLFQFRAVEHHLFHHLHHLHFYLFPFIFTILPIISHSH